MAPREKWTDERLDDLNRKVDDVRTEMREGFAHMNARFDGLNRNLLVIAGAIIAALIGSSVALIGVIAF